ncbi:hypothetical protein WUBG_00787 [Wuchereria bancrofti]|uniref:Ezrin/radixin/moesin C-terminal domain-containing protein n=1 Tax=Wuchereria bancrofti TaxID=6293 RepID=J9BLB7_WUCBA|nr:hypothetical protein WUBG_00787 [Wuchereria bancrofti]
MTEFRNEIESLKVVDRQSEHDRIHAANLQMGIDKYSTLRKSAAESYTYHVYKSGAGATKTRVQVFDGL